MYMLRKIVEPKQLVIILIISSNTIVMHVTNRGYTVFAKVDMSGCIGYDFHILKDLFIGHHDLCLK